MVFCFHCYHQKDWWRLARSHNLGKRAKQKKSWLLVLIRVEKTISQPSWPVFPSSLFPLHLSLIQQWNLPVCSLQGSFNRFVSTAQESSGKPVDVVKCCVMDYLLMQWIFPDSLATSHLQPRKPREIGRFAGGETLLNKIPAEGRSSCAFHCSCARAVGNNSLQDQEPARTQLQRRNPEASNREGSGCVGSWECSGGKQAVTVSGGFLTVQWTAQWH